MKRVYLDHAATTPCDPLVIARMEPYFADTFGNPSSAHWFGRCAVKAVDDAREVIAGFLGCSPLEIYFTGSATEADNSAVAGALLTFAQLPQGFLPHAITSDIEHEAVLEPCRQLEKTGEAEVTYLPVNKEGIVDPEDIHKALRPTTRLVSIMYANSEIGTIQPIAAIGKIIKEENERRREEYLKVKSQKSKSSKIADFTGGAPSYKIAGDVKSSTQKSKLFPIRFHTDAVQAAQFLDCNVDVLNVDLLTLSAHKIYGPKGIGVLYVRRGTPLRSLIRGGGQERGLRAGTENVPLIVGFAEAIRLIKDRKEEATRTMSDLRDHLIRGIVKEVPGTSLNGSRNLRLPNNVNILFKGFEGELLLMALDEEGIAVSTGSACASRSLKPSHTLKALGVDLARAGALRFSLGRETTEAEIEYTIKTVKKVTEKLRKRS
jgi:cysteine desulfurase